MTVQVKTDRRRLQRYPTFGIALLFGDRGETLECVVRDLSEEGACLHGQAIRALPSQFEAWLPTEGVSGLARIAWRNRHACGIVFLEDAARMALRQRVSRRTGSGDRTSTMVARLRAAQEIMRDAYPGSMPLADRRNNGSAETPSAKIETGVELESADHVISDRCMRDDSVDQIAALVRSRLVRLVIGGKATSKEAAVMRRVLKDLSLLRRNASSGSVRIRAFGMK